MISSKHKGFNIVEMLIAMLTIALLSSVSIFSLSYVSMSAKANKIYANLTAIKMAALAWRRDNMDKIIMTAGGDFGKIKWNNDKKHIQEWGGGKDIGIDTYLNNQEIKIKKFENNKNKDGGCYCICSVGSDRLTWYVGYAFEIGDAYQGKGNQLKTYMKDRVEAHKDSWGIRVTDNKPEDSYKVGGNIVWLKICGDYVPKN